MVYITEKSAKGNYGVSEVSMESAMLCRDRLDADYEDSIDWDTTY